MKKLLSILFVLLFFFTSYGQPVISNGGPYNIDQSSKGRVQITETVVGSNIKFTWSILSYYLGNDKSTHQTAIGGEPRFASLKGTSTLSPQVSQMTLFHSSSPDSINEFLVPVDVWDSVTNLHAHDTVKIFLRYWHNYPPQNTDGNAGGHRCTSGDSTTIAVQNQGRGCSIGFDWVIAGANVNGVNNSSGVNQYTGYAMRPNFADTFHVTPGHRVWVIGSKYWSNLRFQWDTAGAVVGPLGDTTAAQIVISPYGPNPLVTQTNSYFSNTRNVRISGMYDPVAHIGNINYQGHQNGSYNNTDNGDTTTYYWYCNNLYGSVAGFGFQMDGISSHRRRIDHLASINGNFSGFTVKSEYSDILNPSSRSQVYQIGDTIDDCYVRNAMGEDFYIGSQNVPAVWLKNCLVYNNESLFSGNKLFKFIDQYFGNRIYNNTGVFGSIRYRFAFSADVSLGMELEFINYGNKADHNLIVGTGNQCLNFLTAKFAATLSGTTNNLSNNAYLHSWGALGSFWKQYDSAFSTTTDSCIFGLHTDFRMNQAYTDVTGTNTEFQTQANPDGRLSGTITKSTYTFTHTLWDSTKYTLPSGTSTYAISSSFPIVHQLSWPTFVNTGFANGVFPELWGDIYFGTLGDEYPSQTGTNQGLPIVYPLGMVVEYYNRFYTSLQNNNSGHPPPVSGSDSWWSLMTFNGSTFPPLDIRLYNTDFYAVRGIGLTDQSGLPVISNFMGSFRKGAGKLYIAR